MRLFLERQPCRKQSVGTEGRGRTVCHRGQGPGDLLTSETRRLVHQLNASQPCRHSPSRGPVLDSGTSLMPVILFLLWKVSKPWSKHQVLTRVLRTEPSFPVPPALVCGPGDTPRTRGVGVERVFTCELVARLTDALSQLLCVCASNASRIQEQDPSRGPGGRGARR